MNKKGFTLIELLATIVILGIVVGIAVVMVNVNINNAKKKTEEVFIDTIRDAMSMYLGEHGGSIKSGGTKCSQILDKKLSEGVQVYKKNVKLEAVIADSNSLDKSELVNPATKKLCKSDIDVNIYADDDYVYYYKIDLYYTDNIWIYYFSDSVLYMEE